MKAQTSFFDPSLLLAGLLGACALFTSSARAGTVDIGVDTGRATIAGKTVSAQRAYADFTVREAEADRLGVVVSVYRLGSPGDYVDSLGYTRSLGYEDTSIDVEYSRDLASGLSASVRAGLSNPVVVGFSGYGSSAVSREILIGVRYQVMPAMAIRADWGTIGKFASGLGGVAGANAVAGTVGVAYTF